MTFPAHLGMCMPAIALFKINKFGYQFFHVDRRSVGLMNTAIEPINAMYQQGATWYASEQGSLLWWRIGKLARFYCECHDHIVRMLLACVSLLQLLGKLPEMWLLPENSTLPRYRWRSCNQNLMHERMYASYTYVRRSWQIYTTLPR